MAWAHDVTVMACDRALRWSRFCSSSVSALSNWRVFRLCVISTGTTSSFGAPALLADAILYLGTHILNAKPYRGFKFRIAIRSRCPCMAVYGLLLQTRITILGRSVRVFSPIPMSIFKCFDIFWTCSFLHIFVQYVVKYRIFNSFCVMYKNLNAFRIF